MTPERWQQITNVFHAALARDAATRSAFLDEACAGDRALRAEVDAMLEAHPQAGNFGEAAAFTISDEASNLVSAKVAVNLSPAPTVHSEFSGSTERGRVPWWMYIVAASYLATFAFYLYLTIWGPAEVREIVATFSDGAMMVQSVTSDSPEAKAGLRIGDRVLTIGSQPMKGPRDWAAATSNAEAERVQQWLVSRGDESVRLEIVRPRATVHRRWTEGYGLFLVRLITALLVGLLLAWKRPSDPAAIIGSWLLLTASIASGLPHGWAAIWREFPAVVQWFLWMPQVSRFVVEGIFLSFCLVFPRPLLTRRWPWFVIWAPVLATLYWRVEAFDAVIHPGQAVTVPAWILQAGSVRTMVYLAAGIVVLAVSYRRLFDLNEKRRIRVLMLGIAVGVMSAIAMVWVDNFLGRLRGMEVLVFAVFPLNLAFPLCFAYALLRHRILDIQVIIRQGLQYALARGAVIGVVPTLGAFLVLDLAVNSQEPLALTMRSRGWIYASLSGLALITYWQRKPWLEALDRRFFRERYNAQRVLRDVVEEIREARSFERVAPRVVSRIETALHPEFASLMVRQPDEPQFRPLASSPSGRSTPSLPADGKLAALLRALEKPLEGLLSSSPWFEQRLPREEIDWVRRARIDLLVPIAVAQGRREALLALGIKRSEEPYTREDQELLEAIAASLSLLVEQTGPGGKPATETFEECPECGACYDFRSGKCTVDDATLTPVQLSRTLVGRYRLERRCGRGGMGTVYEAVDSRLERRVAIKVIRDDWLGSVEAAQRFRREARAAASFAHPNVVTVHDYGVEGDSRGFLVMELLEGRSLRDELHLHRRVDPVRTLWIFRGVCAAVEAAHRRQLIHRDLKPGNIFLAKSGDDHEEMVKVLDFGIAKFLGPIGDDAATRVTAATDAGVLLGTPAYMSPEQLLGGNPNFHWDLWALAVVAYEALTGALPFAKASPEDWRSAILAGRFTPLDHHLANPPSSWESFFARSFDTNQGGRPHSALDFLRQLEEASEQVDPHTS